MKRLDFQQLRGTALSTLMLVGAYAVTTLLGMHDAHAQSAVNSMITNLQGNIANVPKLIYGASYIGGTTALMMGAFKLKAHAENPGQTPMQQGLARLGVGGALIALPTIGQNIATTVSNGEGGSLASQQSEIGLQ